MPSTERTGYSGTPLPQKLGIRDGSRVAVIAGPEGFEDTLGVSVIADLSSGRFDVIVLFAGNRAALEARFEAAVLALQPAGGLWVAWPKRASGVATDLSENVVRDLALARGLVDNKVCAIDAVWSGLRCVYRLADRPGRK